MNTFKESDKVVCVDDSAPTAAIIVPADPLINRAVYCVRESVAVTDGCGVRLVGVFGGLYLNGIEGVWHPRRFRKLAEVRAENTAKSICAKTIAGNAKLIQALGLALVLAVTASAFHPWSNWTWKRAHFRANPSFVACLKK